MKFTGTAPLLAPTVKVVLPTGVCCDSAVTVAVSLMLLGVLLLCAPARSVRVVVVVIVVVELPFRKTIVPLPLVWIA